MCWDCVDADKRTQTIAKNVCDGELEPFITTGELIERLTLEWAETKKKTFQFYRKGIRNSPDKTLSWIAQMGEMQEQIVVNLL